MKNIKVIAFDADDTLWVNEPYFQDVENKFCALLEDYLSHHHISQELFKTEMQNLALYGFGAKSFMLSMIETAIKITDGNISTSAVEKIIEYGKTLLEQPIELLDGVQDVLSSLYGKYQLVVATKGDLLDQERKLEKSKLGSFFHHIEIMSDKKESDYLKLLQHLSVDPESFLMIGNSLKSDVIPVLNIGGFGIHVPYHTTWAHEHMENELIHERFIKLESLGEVLVHLK